MFGYRVFGLTLRTPFACAGLATDDSGQPVDLEVSVGPVPTTLPGAVFTSDWCDAEPGRAIVRGNVCGVRFLVESGSRITADAVPADYPETALELVALALPVAMSQRGLLLMHAGAIVIDGATVIIGGESGAGKSTTVMALHEQGHDLYGDELTVVTRSAGRGMCVEPSVSQVSLTRESLLALGLDSASAWPRPRGRTKLNLDVSLAADPAPIRSVVVLEAAAIADLEVEEITGIAAIQTLQSLLKGPVFPADHVGMFPAMSELLNQATVTRIRRPTDTWSLPKITELVVKTATAHTAL